MADESCLHPRRDRDLRIILGGIGAGIVFELFTLLETQDEAVHAVSPWQDDPYHTVATVAQFTVPVLVAVTGLRLLVWRAPGGADRARQMLRAVALLAGLMALTEGAEWAAVAAGEHRVAWAGWTGLLIAGLAVVSALTIALMALLARAGAIRAAAGEPRHDWLGDVVLLCVRVPALRRWVTAPTAAWVRRHAILVFSGLSFLLGAAEISGMIIGEHWTDPVLISWAILVLAGGNFALSIVGNAVAGFIARPPRGRAHRVTEAAVVTGSIALLVAVAFHNDLQGLAAGRPRGSVSSLAISTLGPAVAAAAATAIVVALCPPSGRSRRARRT